ncbi:SHOCT domain-containing protein [Colwellia demingiae]|uniref:SHOCT domain-containing protein n=1 Tax=Colwellia demingiae TaxID=89401 RepID=A0A5C6QBD2_9GAMM|nr:SHOCT domain-containing protein [Colwellia demingiae]TWX66256.1 SHOCT domain-containing protein [Colwellia demingiae]
MLIAKSATFFIFSLCLFFVSGANGASKEKQYLLQKIAQAPQLETENDQWLLLLEQPGNSQFYYLANKRGKIYQLEQDSPDNTALLLDLQLFSSKESMLQLTAFTLHPNFSLRDQAGFGTFYTAHVEKVINKRKRKRLNDSAVTTPLSYDAIVTEWRLNVTKQVDESSQREVLRIAIPTLESGIRQLNFNPYSKSWHEDFAQLYISLSQSLELKQHPLYSGAILRIHPQRNGIKSYSVPHDNPYYANEKFEKALYLFGAGNINQFIWPDRYATKLLISHQYNFNNIVRHWLSYSDGGEDWRKQAPIKFLYQNKNILAANSLLVYRGQNAPSLRNKLLLLTKNEKQWQLNSLSHEISPEIALENDQSIKQQKALSAPTIEWLLKQQALQANNLTLYRDNRGELLFFNEDSGAIYQLFQQDISLAAKESQQSGPSGLTFFFILVLFVLLGYILYQMKAQQKSAKAFVRREFSNLALTEDKLSIKLFKRHEKEAEKVIALADVNQCQILLGDLVIATINTTLGHGFDEEYEQALREIFHIEQIAKMTDGKVRRINLALHTESKKKHIICLYLRKGSDRITKKGYFTVVDETIDWCWIIAKHINSEQTGVRSFKPTLTTDAAHTEHKTHDDTPLHKQASIIRPATRLHSVIDVIAPEKIVEVTKSQRNDEVITLSDSHDTAAIELARVETDLVNALEKLVKLRQQGFLTADEFEQAKTKLYHFN